MAAAGAAGGLALLYQYCQDRRFDPSASLVRALVIATADEAGPFPGPDYRFGWGLLNIEQAVETLRDAWSGSASVVERALLSSGEVVRYRLRPIPGRAVTLAMSYDDPAGPEIPPSLDSRTRTAVVDLDMWVSVTNPATAVGPTTSIVRPWRLDPSSPEAPASRGDNDVDTIERIDVGADPLPGLKTYILRISHEGFLAGGEQRFSLVARGAILERLPSEWRP